MPALLRSCAPMTRLAKSANWASKVTCKALSSAALMLPSWLMSPNVGRPLKLALPESFTPPAP